MKHKGQGALRGNKARTNVLKTQVRVSRRIRTPLLGLVVKIYIGCISIHDDTVEVFPHDKVTLADLAKSLQSITFFHC